MKTGFVSAILADLSFDEVLKIAVKEGFQAVEMMCWPRGKAERRYAGVTHIDVVGMDAASADLIKQKAAKAGIQISALGYYPNPLTADLEQRAFFSNHIKKVIDGAALLGVGVVNTFIGREPSQSLDDSWVEFRKVWPELIKYAEGKGVKVAIENCPMFFSKDEWPGGKNMASTPVIWKRMFEEIDSPNFGLNYDPSHLIWQQMDCVKPLRDFKDKLFHIHIKDAKVLTHKLDEVGIMAMPLDYHMPKLPGLGDVNWGEFFCYLTEAGYDGPVCIEVEDRAYEGSLDNRTKALRQSLKYISQFIG